MKVLPEAFTAKNTDELPPRIIGVECEYNIQRSSNLPVGEYISDKVLDAAEIPHHGPYLGTAGGRGKLYVDGGLLEYATEERLGPASAAVADLEGAQILSRVVQASRQKHRGLYRLAGTYIPPATAQVASTAGKTSGYHVNLIIPRAIANDELIDTWVATQLSARSYAMSGTLYGADYVLSQKVWGIGASPVERSINRRTLHGFKPMLLIPPRDWDTDTIGGHGYARAEVRFAEPGQSLVARYADFAALSLAFRVVEQRRMFGKGKIRASSVIDPVHAAKMFAADMTCTKAALTIGGKHVTVLDIQEDLLDKAVVIAERVRLPQDEYEAIDVLRALNDALRQSNPERAEYATNARKWMDFAVRHQFLSKEVPPESVSAGDQTIMQRNLAWDRILPEGPGMRYWARLAERDPLVARIHEHADNFGTADRALARAAIIDSGMSLNYVKDWASYIHNEKVRSFGNPYGKR